MRDHLEIGSAPWDEECVQVQTDADYLPAMRAECERFIKLIRERIGPEPDGAQLGIKTNPHDFGTYLEVVCYFEDTIPAAVDYAFECEGSRKLARW